MKFSPKCLAFDLAKYILAISGPMSHLKLQKLLYYVEAWHLAFYEEPLLNEDFKAWVHGPVCVPVWHEIKKLSILNDEVKVDPKHKDAIISRVEKCLGSDVKSLVRDILGEYGTKSSHYLEALTHSEAPWIEARGNLPLDEKCSVTIKKSTMKTFYRAKFAKSGKA